MFVRVGQEFNEKKKLETKGGESKEREKKRKIQNTSGDILIRENNLLTKPFRVEWQLRGTRNALMQVGCKAQTVNAPPNQNIGDEREEENCYRR